MWPFLEIYSGYGFLKNFLSVKNIGIYLLCNADVNLIFTCAKVTIMLISSRVWCLLGLRPGHLQQTRRAEEMARGYAPPGGRATARARDTREGGGHERAAREGRRVAAQAARAPRERAAAAAEEALDCE